MLKLTPTFWSVRLFVLALALMTFSCDKKNPPGPNPVNLQISFTQPEIFYLSDVQDISYALPYDQPASITAVDVPTGWTVKVNTVEKKIRITCGLECPASNWDCSAKIVLTASTGETTSKDLNLKCKVPTFAYADGVVAADGWQRGNGTEASPYGIWNPGQLKKLVDDVNGGETFDGVHFKLMVNIDVTADEWIPVGTQVAGSCFSGSFDGNGMTISGHLQSESYSHFGFFGHVSQAGDIKNLNLTADVTNNYDGSEAGVSTGGVVGFFENSGTISGCTITGAITGSNSVETNRTGGIAGRTESPITQCTVSSTTVTGGGANTQNSTTGAIVGTTMSDVSDCEIIDVVVTGGNGNGIIGGSITGGVAGYSEGAISGCKLTRISITGAEAMGDIEKTRTYAGNVVGYTEGSVSTCDLTDCTVIGGAGAMYSYTGGVVAFGNGEISTNTVTGGTITGGSAMFAVTGGIAGSCHAATLQRCTVSATTKVQGGNATGFCATGGISGETGDIFLGCQMKGATQGGTSLSFERKGGLVGFLMLSGRIHSSDHSGTVTAGIGSTIYMGSLVGYSTFGNNPDNCIIYNCCRNTGTPEQLVGYDANYILADCDKGHTTYLLRVPSRALVPSAEVSAPSRPLFDTLSVSRTLTKVPGNSY